MSFPGSTIEERLLRGAIRLGAWTTGSFAWNSASTFYDDLLDYLLHWPNTDPSVPAQTLYCGMLPVDIIKGLNTLTGLDRADAQSDFDYLGDLLNASDA